MHDVCAKAGSACKSTLLLNLDIGHLPINHLEHTNGPSHAKIYCQTPFHAKIYRQTKKKWSKTLLCKQALAPASACLQLALTVKVTPGGMDRRVLGYAIRSVDCTQCVERNQEKH